MSSREHHLGDRTSVNGHGNGRCPRVASGAAPGLRPMGLRLSVFPTRVRRNSTAPRTVKLDMAEVRELDTLGAMALEKMSRRATSAGHRADIVGVSDHYAGLIEEVRQVNRRTPRADPARNPIVAKISDIGRSTIGASEDVTAFLQMLRFALHRHSRRAAPSHGRCG